MQERIGWLRGVRAYLAAILGLNLVWEVAQLPLYALPPGVAPPFLAAVIAEGVSGDLMIAGAALLAALVLAGDPRWPEHGFARVGGLATLFGAGYTVYSEWWHVQVIHEWGYGPAMPLVPPFGTGLSPLLEWVLLPPIALLIARRAAHAAR